VDLFI